MENLAHGVSLSRLSIFPVFLQILIFFLDFIVVLEQILISIEEISVLYNRDSDFTKVQTKIEAKNLDFLSLMGFLSLNYPFS